MLLLPHAPRVAGLFSNDGVVLAARAAAPVADAAMQGDLTALRTLLADYSQTSPQVMQFLADRYLAKGVPFRLAIIPEGQQLASAPPAPAAAPRAVAPAMTGR